MVGWMWNSCIRTFYLASCTLLGPITSPPGEPPELLQGFVSLYGVSFQDMQSLVLVVGDDPALFRRPNEHENQLHNLRESSKKKRVPSLPM